MKEVKINKNPIIIENNNFQTIQINVLYPYQKEEKNLAKDIILPSMLMYINNDYPTEKEFSKALKERFILKLHSFPTTIGTTNYLTFSLTIPDKKSLKQDFIEEQIKFLHNTIYNPKIENNGFLPFEVERELKNLKLLIDNINKSFNPYLNYKIKKLVDTEGLLSLNIKEHEEQLKDICEKLKKDYDFILVDCPAGIEQGFQNAVAGATEAIVVTTPEMSAVRDADRIIGLLEAKEGIESYRLLLNRVRPNLIKSKDMMSVEDVVEILSADLIGIIPEDTGIITSTNKGEPIVNDEKSLAGRAYMNVARRIMGEDVDFMNLEEETSVVAKVKKFFKG